MRMGIPKPKTYQSCVLEWIRNGRSVYCIKIMLLKFAPSKLVLKLLKNHSNFVLIRIELKLLQFTLALAALFVIIIIISQLSCGSQNLKGHLGAKGIVYFPISSPPVLSSQQDNDTRGLLKCIFFFGSKLLNCRNLFACWNLKILVSLGGKWMHIRFHSKSGDLQN